MMPARVTDHAVRRYAERALHLVVDDTLDDPAALSAIADQGIDVEAIRRRIGAVCHVAADTGAVGVKADNVRLVLRGQSVVTVLEKRLRPHYFYEEAA